MMVITAASASQSSASAPIAKLPPLKTPIIARNPLDRSHKAKTIKVKAVADRDAELVRQGHCPVFVA